MEITQSEYDRLKKKADDYDDDMTTVKLIVGGIIGAIVLLMGVIFAWKLINPQLNLYKANTEKQAQIAQSKSKAEAAKYEAMAEVERARGAAEANKIIASSLTEEYLRYLYINNLDVAGASVIYIPTEAGLPILEAGTRTTTTEAP